MRHLQEYIDAELARGRGYFTKASALAEAGLTPQEFQGAASRQKKKGWIVSPRRGFYLIVRPEDRAIGAPDPARWIDPLMKYLGLDYRISLLRAAAFHGASHQAAMVFQVIAAKQLSKLNIGRQRVEFLYQSPDAFAESNRPEWLSQLKTEAGFAQVAGVELALLDICRYFHQAAGIGGAAQSVRDLGKKADPWILTKAARSYPNTSVRRLGYLLDRFGHVRQAEALRVFAKEAKSYKSLNPAAKPLVAELGGLDEVDHDWKLVINVPVEVDS